MGKYRSLGTKFDRDYRNDLNANFDDIDTDIQQTKNLTKQLLDGSFQQGELNTEIEQRLNGLEEEYTPRLTGVESQLAQKAQQTDLINIDAIAKDAQIKANSPVDQIADGSISNTKILPYSLTQNEISETLLQQMTGNTPINAVPADGGVSETKLANAAATSLKRTRIGEQAFITCPLPLNINTVNKTIEFPDNGNIRIPVRGGNVNIASTYRKTSFDVSFGGATGGWIAFDTATNNLVAVYGSVQTTESMVFLGAIWWSPNISISLHANFTVDGKIDAYGKVHSNQRTSAGSFGMLTASQPFNIDTVNKTLDFPNVNNIQVAYNAGSTNISGSYQNTKIDISFEGSSGGWIYFNTATNNILVSYGSIKPNEDCILLGVIWWSGGLYYLNANYTVDGKAKDAASIPKKFNGKVLNGLGDSITYGDIGDGSQGVSWINHLTNLNGFTTVRNYGVKATTIAVRSGRSDSFVERFISMENNADVITVFGAANDFNRGVPLGTFQSRDNTEFYGALHNLITGLIAKYPKAQITFFTPMKNNKSDGFTPSFSQNSQGLTQIAYVNAIKEVCDYYSIPVLDLYSYGGISPFVDVHVTNFMPDKLHPNNNGYARLAQKIATHLESL